MDKPLFDSDVDPKRIKNVADGLRRQGEFESARMLDGYADRLEADEQAVPSAWMVSDDGWNQCFTTLEQCQMYGKKLIPLYTHPAPADAERLAEALRNMLDVVDPAHWPTYVRDAKKALAAHSAQAQPPAARVPDEMVMRLKRALPLFCADVTMADARAALESALAAQENPNG